MVLVRVRNVKWIVLVIMRCVKFAPNVTPTNIVCMSCICNQDQFVGRRYAKRPTGSISGKAYGLPMRFVWRCYALPRGLRAPPAARPTGSLGSLRSPLPSSNPHHLPTLSACAEKPPHRPLKFKVDEGRAVGTFFIGYGLMAQKQGSRPRGVAIPALEPSGLRIERPTGSTSGKAYGLPMRFVWRCYALPRFP